MATTFLFHHALGLTSSFAYAHDLRASGHVVHVPDLYEGRTFTDLNEGVAHAEKTGFDTITERGIHAADRLPAELVYAGFSMGAMPAQKLAQSRPGARGALLFHSSIPLKYYGGVWPAGVPLQIHTMENDSGVTSTSLARSHRRSRGGALLYPETGTSSPTGAFRITTSTPRAGPRARARFSKTT